MVSKPVERKAFLNIAHYLALKYASAGNIISLADHYALKQGKQLHVLVSEDNKVNQMVIMEVLAKVGHQVTLVEDGEQALDAMDANVFDLAIIDFNMPKVSGLEVIKICRFRKDLRNLPIIVLSADATPETQKICEEAGADEFITKPFNSKHLLGLIAKLSGARQASLVGIGGGASAVVEVFEELIDFNVLSQLLDSGVGMEFIDNLLEEFSRQGEQQLRVISSIIGRRDTVGLQSELHTLKGSAAYLGASHLVKLCEKSEVLIKGGDFASQKNMMENIEAVFHSTCAVLTDYIKQSKNPH